MDIQGSKTGERTKKNEYCKNTWFLKQLVSDKITYIFAMKLTFLHSMVFFDAKFCNIFKQFQACFFTQQELLFGRSFWL